MELEVEGEIEFMSTQTITEEEAGITEATIAAFRKEKQNNTNERNDSNERNDPNATNDNIKIVEDPSNSNYNTTRTVPNSTTTPQESNTTYSQLSVALPPSLAV